MPILLWVIYPFAIWSACADMIADRSAIAAKETEPPRLGD
jgi:hypothetical protein